MTQSGSLAAAAHNAYAQQAVQLAGSAQAAQAQSAAHAAAYASAAKTANGKRYLLFQSNCVRLNFQFLVAVDAAALQAVSGISSLGSSAASNFGAGYGGYGH